MRIFVVSTLALAACSPPADDTKAPEAQQVAATSGSATSPPAEGPTFSSVGELTRPDNVNTELRGARIADPQQWQASFYTRSAGGMCTASIVGDRVLLTAAHCVANGAAVTLQRGGVGYRAMCEHAPQYNPGSPTGATADYALCAIEKSIPGIPAERVNKAANALKVGTEVTLTGFGCTTNQGTGGNDGIYRIGEVKIKTLPGGTNNDIVTEGKVGLCFGDSGGPAFLVGPGKARVQISVNSRVENKSPTGVDLGDKSFLSSLTSVQGAAFLKDWSQRNGLHICGIDDKATTCRS